MDDIGLIKIKNVIDMAFTFTAMNRVFQKESKRRIVQELELSFQRLAAVQDRAAFESIHSQFCDWFVGNVRTAQKHLPNNTTKQSRNASYGHAAKMFDVASKVYVYYCHLPSSETAVILLPLLHGAVDTPMMEYLKTMFQADNIRSNTIEGVSSVEYAAIQVLVARHIEKEFNGIILPVQYDDIMWRRLNRTSG